MHVAQTSKRNVKNKRAWSEILHFSLSNPKAKPSTIQIALLVCTMLGSATPSDAFIHANWECREDESQADCLKDGGLKSIFVFGEIVSGDARKIEDFDLKIPNDKPFPKIFITSPGGSGIAAMKIGHVLRRRNAQIEGRDLFFPDRPAMCYSACVWLAAGAIDRQFDQIGVHRGYRTGQDKSCNSTREDISDTDLDRHFQYIIEMGLPEEILDHVKSTPSESMTEFYFDPASKPEEQMIVKLGFRMHPTLTDAPIMFDIKGKPRFTSSFQLKERGAEEGNSEAADALGRYYEEISKKNLNHIWTAVYWYERAGELGYYLAYHNLGVIFGNSHLLKTDQKKAVTYYLKAAEMGFSGSQNNLGWSYYKGSGVPKNYGFAIYWLTRSVEQGERFAYSSLGKMRFYAHGFPADDVEAYKWIKLAASSLPIGKVRDENFRLLEVLRKRMSAKEIEQAEALAKAWNPLKQTSTFMRNICNEK